MEMILVFCDRDVGRVDNAFLSDEVWSGTFTAKHHSDLPSRVSKYIDFCKDWNERAKTGNADAEEFEAFRDIVSEGLWRAKLASGDREIVIEDAPNFFFGEDVTFRGA